MLQLLIKIMIVWFALDIFFLATIWYMRSTLRPMFPQWWQSHVCDYAPEYF
ncbi:MAG: hypothetical protein AAF629_03005 [Chloroflexota bacterium]